MLAGVKLRGAAVGTAHHAVWTETSCIAGPTTDVKSHSASLYLSTTVVANQEYTIKCSTTHDSVYSIGGGDSLVHSGTGADYKVIERDHAISSSDSICLLVLSATDVPTPCEDLERRVLRKCFATLLVGSDAAPAVV